MRWRRSPREFSLMGEIAISFFTLLILTLSALVDLGTRLYLRRLESTRDASETRNPKPERPGAKAGLWTCGPCGKPKT
mgnify:CR=1 FL=1